MQTSIIGTYPVRIPHCMEKHMKQSQHGRRIVWMLALGATVLATSACADEPRRLAYRESVVQNGKATFTSTGTVDLKKGPANAAMLAAALARMPAVTTTALTIDGSVQTV